MPKWIPLLHKPDELRKLYAEYTVREIAAQVGCVPAAVTQALHRHGIPTRPPGQPSAPKELKDKEWLEKRYAEYNTHQIAAQLGCAQVTVWKALYALGIPVNGFGARFKENILSRVRMTSKGGKVKLLHRYLMEQHLGRQLSPSEDVHHIDGNPKNNALNNLIVLSKEDHRKLHRTKKRRVRS